jgi:hypothetical protein
MANTLAPEHELVLRAQDFGMRTAEMCRIVAEKQWYENGLNPEEGILQHNYVRAVQLICASSRLPDYKTIIGLLVDGIDTSIVPAELLDMVDHAPKDIPKDPEVTRFCTDLGKVLRVPEYGYSLRREPDTLHSLGLTLEMAYIAKIAPKGQRCGNISRLLVMPPFHDADEIISGDIPTLGASMSTMDTKHARVQNDLELMETEYPSLLPLHYWMRVYHAQKSIGTRPIRMIDKADPSRTHAPNKGIVLKRNYGYNTPEKYLHSLSGPNKVMAAGYTDLPFYLAVINEARAQAIVATYEGIGLTEARQMVRDQAEADGLYIPKKWNVLGSYALKY